MQQKSKNILFNILSAVTTLLCMLLVLFSICFFVFNLSYSKTRVRGYSMQPTINKNVQSANEDGDLVYLNTFRGLKTDTIVVADVSWWQKGSIIKRLVAMPGDVIRIEQTATEYNLLVNNNLVYSKAKYDTFGNLNTDVRNYFEHKYQAFITNTTSFDGYFVDHSSNLKEVDGNICIVLNEDEYFLIGDNWTDSMVDCMTFGPVNKSEIVGTVELIVDVKDNMVLSVARQILKILFFV